MFIFINCFNASSYLLLATHRKEDGWCLNGLSVISLAFQISATPPVFFYSLTYCLTYLSSLCAFILTISCSIELCLSLSSADHSLFLVLLILVNASHLLTKDPEGVSSWLVILKNNFLKKRLFIVIGRVVELEQQFICQLLPFYARSLGPS